ncbi:MAG: hypothetical protein ACLTSS_07830 [Phocaeicola coprocola]
MSLTFLSIYRKNYGLPCLTDLSECRKIVYLHSLKKCNRRKQLTPVAVSADREHAAAKLENILPSS